MKHKYNYISLHYKVVVIPMWLGIIFLEHFTLTLHLLYAHAVCLNMSCQHVYLNQLLVG